MFGLFVTGFFLFVFFLSTVNSEPLEQSKNLRFPLEVSPILLEVLSDEGPDSKL